MKNQIIKLLAVAVAVSLGACTKERQPSFPDGQGADVFPKTLFSGSEVKVTTAAPEGSVDSLEAMKSKNQKMDVSLKPVAGPSELYPMFKNLLIKADGGQELTFRFAIDKKFVTAYLVASASNSDSLTEEQIETAERSVSNPDELLVPTFQFAVKSYGVLVRAKNDLKEDTSTLRIDPSEFSNATHVQVSMLASDRSLVRVNDPTLSDSVFLKDRVDQQVMDKATFTKVFGIKLDLEDSALLYTRLGADGLKVFQIKTADQLTEAQRQSLTNSNLADRDDPIEKCSDELLQKVPAQFKDSCYIANPYTVSVNFVMASRSKDADGIADSNVSYKPNPKGGAGVLVQIEKGTEPASTVSGANSLTTLEVDQFKDNEFLLRRTLMDSPNGFDYTFAGESGPLEIVKFKFSKNNLDIIRSRPILKADGNTGADNERIFSVPVRRYFVMKNVDERGNTLSYPRKVQVDYTTPGAIADVMWLDNSISNISSPLDYYSLEECFDGARIQKMLDVTKNKEGTKVVDYSFSLDTTYQASRGMDCVGVYSADYFATKQTTYTFRERISFKKYERTNETPLFSIPYDAQRKLGFGLFTYKKITPNAAGNFDRDGGEQALGAIFDLSNNRKITYVLAGIPTEQEDKVLRDRLIKATREVVADWNRAFVRALKGTPAERKDDIIELKIEGVDSEPAQLGDLNRNYLYYIKKRTNSPIIGLGGAHANPRTGEVEAASVFVYGGNIRSYIESLQRRNAIVNRYNEVFKFTPDPVASPAPEASSTPSAVASGPMLMEPKMPGQVSGRLGSAKFKPEGSLKISGLSKDVAAKLGLTSIQKMDQRMVHPPGKDLFGLSDSEIRSLVGNLSEEERAIFDGLQAAKKAGDLGDARAIETHVLEAQVARLKGTAYPMQAERLRARLSQRKSIQKLMKRLEQANICVYEADAELGQKIIAASQSPEAQGATDEVMELTIGVYKATLLHELGHNLGLRHNFEGSFDADNFRRGDDLAWEKKRQYTSIMDYLQDDHENYGGAGPQDIYSLRVAYGKRFETLTGIPIKFEDLMASLGIKSWLQLTSKKLESSRDMLMQLAVEAQKAGADLSKRETWISLEKQVVAQGGGIPLKKYMFCSDEEAGQIPICNRFDKGTTPEEIVANHAIGYRSTYASRNFPGDRLRFGMEGTGGYVGYLFEEFVQIRQFLEETFYQAMVVGADGETIGSYLRASAKGLLFFHEVVRTPDAPGAFSTAGRAVPIKLNVGGVDGSFPVERKALNTSAFDEGSDRIGVRGIELDKVVATIMLTERYMGFPRYEQASIRLAYPILENILADIRDGMQKEDPKSVPDWLNLIAGDTKKPETRITLSLLKEGMMNQIKSLSSMPMPAPEGKTTLERVMLPLPATFETKSTELMRLYSVIGAAVSLDTAGVEVADNFATLYRVLSGKVAPKDSLYIVQPGGDISREGEQKFWAYYQSPAAAQLISRINAISAINEKKADIKKAVFDVGNLMAEVDQEKDEAKKAELQKQLDELVKSTNALLSGLPAEVGSRDVIEIEAKINDLALGVLTAAMSGNQQMLIMQQNAMKAAVKEQPILEPALASLAPIMPEGMGDLVTLDEIKMQQSEAFASVNMLNLIFVSNNPSYR